MIRFCFNADIYLDAMHLKSIRFKTTLTHVWTGASITSLFLASGQIVLTLLLMGTRAPGPSLV